MAGTTRRARRLWRDIKCEPAGIVGYDVSQSTAYRQLGSTVALLSEAVHRWRRLLKARTKIGGIGSSSRTQTRFPGMISGTLPIEPRIGTVSGIFRRATTCAMR